MLIENKTNNKLPHISHIGVEPRGLEVNSPSKLHPITVTLSLEEQTYEVNLPHTPPTFPLLMFVETPGESSSCSNKYLD